MKLRDDIGTFDVVLLANLIDRLPNPRRCLAQLPKLINRGGQLIIVSPYTWLEAYTPRKNWLGGTRRGGRAIRTLDTLREILVPDFTLTARRDLPFPDSRARAQIPSSAFPKQQYGCEKANPCFC